MTTLEALNRMFEPVIGVPFGELEAAQGHKWSGDQRKDKSLAARLARKALEIDAQTAPPWPVRTVPVGTGLDVLEHTKVVDLRYDDTHDMEFEASHIGRRLRGLLLVPVMKHNPETPHQWYIRSPILWVPSEEQEAQFARDYAEVQEMVREGTHDQLSAAEPPSGQGRWLTTNTSGRDGSDRREVRIGDKLTSVKPRAWFVRKDVMRGVIQANLGHGSMRDRTIARSLDDFDVGD